MVLIVLFVLDTNEQRINVQDVMVQAINQRTVRHAAFVIASIKKDEKGYCGLCEKYPCKRLKILYKRYHDKYGVDIYQNLKEINAGRIEEFIMNEENKWKCIKCGSIACMHKSACLHCGELNPYFIGSRT